MSETKDTPNPPPDGLPEEIGRRMARRLFEARGNHTEAHLREEELADCFASAVTIGNGRMGTALASERKARLEAEEYMREVREEVFSSRRAAAAENTLRLEAEAELAERKANPLLCVSSTPGAHDQEACAGCEPCQLRAQVAQLTKERDEARAQAEKLRKHGDQMLTKLWEGHRTHGIHAPAILEIEKAMEGAKQWRPGGRGQESMGAAGLVQG